MSVCGASAVRGRGTVRLVALAALAVLLAACEETLPAPVAPVGVQLPPGAAAGGGAPVTPPGPAGGGGGSPVTPPGPADGGDAPVTAPSTPQPSPGPAGGDAAAAVVAAGLEEPWDLALLPDGSVLIGERASGRLTRVSPSGQRQQAGTVPLAGGGLLGLAPSPDFSEDGQVYAVLEGDQGRLVRFRLTEGGDVEPEPVMELPGGRRRNGGRIGFGPDGLLYVGTGDGQQPEVAADPASLSGKVLRITRDGTVPPDNPIPGSPVYSLGHRNVHGLAGDRDGRLHLIEQGETLDEVNRVTAGGDHGWPAVEGVADRDGLVDPVATLRTDPDSPRSSSGAAFVVLGSGPQPESLVIGTRDGLLRLDGELGGGQDASERLHPATHGQVRDVEQAPDGSLWAITNRTPGGEGDVLLRLGGPS